MSVSAHTLDPDRSQELADWISAAQNDIIRAWADAVRADPLIQSDRSLSYAEFIDHIPNVLREICEQLRGVSFAAQESSLREEARTHGSFRWRQGYDLAEVMREIAHLRQVILSFVPQAKEVTGASDEESVAFVRLISRTLDEGQIATVLRHIRERDREIAERDQEVALRKEESAELDRRLQQSLLEKERGRAEALGSAARLKDEFLATLSHELRTPLTAMLAWITILERDRSAPNVASAIEALERNARVLGQLIDDLLDISRILADKLELVREPLDVRTVIHAACGVVQSVATSRNVALRMEESPEPLSVLGDFRRLQQVLWNLLSNAVRFSQPAGEVRIRAEAKGDEIWISVADDGVGIDPDFLPYIFDRFRQQDQRPTRWHGGLGLGLAIAQAISAAHGGALTATSEGRGAGSRFELRLPKYQDASNG